MTIQDAIKMEVAAKGIEGTREYLKVRMAQEENEIARATARKAEGRDVNAQFDINHHGRILRNLMEGVAELRNLAT